MGKLILRKGRLLKFLEEDCHLLLEDCKSGEIIYATYSTNISAYSKFEIGNTYLIVFSPYDLTNGRVIYSEKGYDLDYSYL